jgi:1-acyl-sn-glycerol-3-phosphate acyltransferase
MIWLRSAIYQLWFYSVSVVLVLACAPLLVLPRTLAYRSVFVIARLWARMTLGGLRPICGIDVVVTGWENLPKAGPALIASNHQSAFDTIVWMKLLDQVAYVLKKDLQYIPLYGQICVATGMIIVDRAAGANAIRVLLAGASRVVAQGRTIVIFPEGTRASPGTIGELHPGVAGIASHTGLPVIPVVTDSGEHWGRRGFRRFPGTITIAIRPALPAGLKRQDLLGRLNAEYRRGVAPDVDKSVEPIAHGFQHNNK